MPINPLTITINRSKTRKLPYLPAGGHSQMRELEEVFLRISVNILVLPHKLLCPPAVISVMHPVIHLQDLSPI